MGTSTPNFNLYKPSVGETGWGASVDTNFDTIDSNMLSGGLPRSYLAGYGLSNNGSPSFTLSIAVGQCQDVANAGAIQLAAAIIKDLSGAWSVGSGNGGRGTGVAYTPNTWYHVFIIKRTDTNVVDAYFDTSATAANIPAPYTLFRRIGSVRSDGLAAPNILQFHQNGDEFRWDTSVRDINDAAPGTGPTTRTLTVPTGVVVWADVVGTNAQGANAVYISPLDCIDEAPSFTGSPTATWGVDSSGGILSRAIAGRLARTNTSAQVRSRSSTNITIVMTTYGWIDRRGRDA